MIKLIILLSLIQSSNFIEKKEINDYLQEINFTDGLKSQYLLILPLNKDYYVDNHWVHGLLNLPNRYPKLSVVIVERDIVMAKKLVTNKKLKIAFDDRAFFYWTKLYTGTAVLLEKQNEGYSITKLTISNAYQEKLSLYGKIK